MAELEVVERRQKRRKRCDSIKARVEAGLQIVRPNGQKRTALLAEVAAFAHQTDAGDQALIAADERVEIGKQRPANVVLQIRQVAAVTAKAAVGDGERQADLLRHFRQRHGRFDVLERGLRNRRHPIGYDIRRRCGRRPAF